MAQAQRTQQYEGFMPQAYQAIRDEGQRSGGRKLHPHSDISHYPEFNARLTFSLMEILRARHIIVRREFHVDQESAASCFILADQIGEVPADPSDEDVITHVTPWGFEGADRLTGYLRGRRDEVAQLLQEAKAPEYAIALVGLETIMRPYHIETPEFHPPA